LFWQKLSGVIDEEAIDRGKRSIRVNRHNTGRAGRDESGLDGFISAEQMQGNGPLVQSELRFAAFCKVLADIHYQ
jgi:hypothetical protein